MLINIVALEMLRVKLPAGKKVLFVFAVVVCFYVVVVSVTFDVIVLMLRKSLLWIMLINIVPLNMLRLPAGKKVRFVFVVLVTNTFDVIVLMLRKSLLWIMVKLPADT